MRNRALQHENRLREIARAIAYTSGDIQVTFREIRECEAKAEALKARANKAQKKLAAVKALQDKLIETPTWSEFGLPTDVSNEEFSAITGEEITS